MNIFRKKRIPNPSGLQQDVADAVENFRAAEAKMNMVVDEDMIDAAIYEFMAAKMRLGYLIRLRRVRKYTV